MLSFCGLECAECPAFIATRADDMDALAKVAAEWSEQFGMEVKPEAIMCDGCVSDTGRHSGYCDICEVYQCASGREVATCASCEDYACTKLLACPAYEKGKETLERLRTEL